MCEQCGQPPLFTTLTAEADKDTLRLTVGLDIQEAMMLISCLASLKARTVAAAREGRSDGLTEQEWHPVVDFGSQFTVALYGAMTDELTPEELAQSEKVSASMDLTTEQEEFYVENGRPLDFAVALVERVSKAAEECKS